MKYFSAGLSKIGALFLAMFLVVPMTAVSETVSYAGVADPLPVIVFGRDDCGFCIEQFEFLAANQIDYVYYNIVEDPTARELFNQLTEKHQLSRVTPITVVGEQVFVGFNGGETTGKRILTARLSDENNIRTIEDHLALATPVSVQAEDACTDVACVDVASSNFVYELPFLGVVDLRSFSLFSLSLILGVIDGFNPCAMWVLVTFLVLLSQAGSKKKMIVLAGVFILAQGIMYNLILNVWYKTWDFIALDEIVTPLVGFLALGGGAFFLWRWHRNKKTELVCDITNIETQSKTINKFKQVVNQPITIASLLAILLIAFSVNVIEFACSIGIPQAYTKILEMNALAFLERQGYILVFTLGYMFDDFVVFALAIWGYSRLQAHGGKYAQLSLLIGGVLMLFLGLILLLDPNIFKF